MQNKDFGQLATELEINNVKLALERNNIKVILAENKQEAFNKFFELVPEKAEIMTMSSVTLAETGVLKEIEESGKYNPVKKKFATMDRKTQGQEMQKMGAAPDYATGSVHAVTEDGKIVVASATGSQLPAYAFGSNHVIWIVGAQKIVKNIEEGEKRVYEYVLPLENERAMKSYGQGSSVNKMLIINKEVNPSRLTMIIVKEKLGF